MRNKLHVQLCGRKKLLHGLILSCSVFILCSVLTCLPSYGQQSGQGVSAPDVPHVISYQGSLTTLAGQPVSDGKYSVRVTLYSDAVGANYVWQDNYTVDVKSGVFSVLLGSGSSQLPRLVSIDQPLWVGVAIGNQPELRPLTVLSSVPYALNVADNSITAKKMATDFIGKITVDAAPLSIKGQTLDLRSGKGIDLNYDKLTNSLSFNLSNPLTGKGGAQTQAYIGAGGVPACPPTDNNALTNSIGFASNAIVGGGANGFASVLGGWGNRPTGDYSSIIGGAENQATSCGATVAGGGILPNYCNAPPTCGTFGAFKGNTAKGISSFIGAGGSNNTKMDLSVIGGGERNTTNNKWNTIGGGRANNTSGDLSTIGGGDSNKTSNDWNTIGGGHTNIIIGRYSTIGGGDSNQTNNDWATVGGGFGNIAGGGPMFLVTQTVGGGDHNYAWGDGATIAGGEDNKAWSMHDFIGGGRDNQTILQNLPCNIGTHNVICGGFMNRANGYYSMIPGGSHGQTRDFGQMAHASGSFTTVPGAGDAQTSFFVMRDTSISGGGFVSLFLDGITQRITVPANGAMAVHVLIIGKTAGCSGAAVTGGWDLTFTAIDGCFGAVNIGAVNATILNPLPAGWAFNVVGGAANPSCGATGTIDIKVTSGGTAGTVYWVASAWTSEVVF